MITPKTIYWSFGSLIIISILFYLSLQVSAFAFGPGLFVDLPKNLTITDESIVVNGHTSKNSRVFINNQELLVLENGDFKQEVYLQPGENILNIKSINHKNKITSEQIMIFRK